ncbi:amidase [Sediminicoccus sp. BL-A-41-H5]|uniref:amidase n=1 Tax=Sediminicoccus sp. BL-A-41-H5 TaxID=3421106 RepID=UPI003D67880B
MTDPASLSAAQAAQRIAAGSLSATDLAEAMLARIAAREPVLRAFTHHEPALVMRQAARVDAAVKGGTKLPLAGLFLGVKDVLDTADQPSQYGSPIWGGHRPRSDAACVALARRAGAIIAGKTVTTEFATRFPGPTTNPHNPGHTPGGSSSGSAAGVGAGVLHLAFGTQTAGSIVRPAAYCGAVGFKPSYGAFHRAGMKVMSESLDTIGLMGSSVADVALGMTAMTGFDHSLTKPGRAPKLALVLAPGQAGTPETAGLMAFVSEAARKAGATVTLIELGAPFTDAVALHPHVMNMESAEALGWEIDHARAQLSPILREKMEWALAEPRAKLAEGRAAFAAAQLAFNDAIAGYDAVLTPSAPDEAPAGTDYTGDPMFNTLWTLLHTPAVTVPVGKGPKGLPLGAQIVTRRGEDAACLMWGEWLHGAVHG